MFQEHGRHAIWNQAQHPFKHTGSDFSFVHPSMPGVTTIEGALNWMVAVVYPQTKPQVATPADLPLIGNSLGDYRVVADDGDGKSSAYRWEQREGDVAAKWYKIYDMDWGVDSILTQYHQQSLALYVLKQGNDDLDYQGNVIAGTYAGQRIFGGASANTNLTLSANSGDGTGSQTGYIQFTDNLRPTTNNAFDLGTSSNKFKSLYLAGSLYAGTLTATSGSITDSSGAISFDNENLSTTGTLGCGALTASSALINADISISAGSITSISGAISFDNENLTTTGFVHAGAITGTSLVVNSDLTLGTGSITSVSGTISFDNENLTTTGNINGAIITASTKFVTGSIAIIGPGTIISATAGDLNFTAPTGGIVFNAAMYGTTGEFTGSLKAGTIFEADGSIYMSGVTNTIATYAADITLSPSTNVLKANALIKPTSDNTRDLGTTALRWGSLYLGGAIGDGTNTISIADLLSLRSINTGATAGMALFYDGSKWLPSIPDTEIAHASLSGLLTGDAGHTQFVMLAGRSGGQTVQGGTAAGEHLLLESTSNASKGLIKAKDGLVPNTNASYSSGWSGTDLGGASNYWNDIYSKGVHKGLRLENYTSGTLPGSSSQNVGRLVYATDTNKIYVDNGSAFQVAGVGKYCTDQSFDGVVTTKTVTVSASITDARNAIWQLLDNANDFDRIYCTIKAISASQVTITTTVALPVGSYRLIGLE